MDWAAQCAVVIPCHNEAATIARIAAAAARYVPQVFVIDDASTDATPANARAAGATVLKLPRRQGKGAALRQGWAEADQRGFDWAIMLDGDGQHAPEDIPRFFASAEGSQAQLIIGNRFAGGAAAMPWNRRVANRWMSWMLSREAGATLPDSQCGFRLMSLAAARGLRFESCHYEIESEMIVAFLAAGHEIEFIPVTVIYHGERSKICPLTDSWRWLTWRRKWRQREESTVERRGLAAP